MNECPICQSPWLGQDEGCEHYVLGWDVTFAEPLGGTVCQEVLEVFELVGIAVDGEFRPGFKAASLDEGWLQRLSGLVSELKAFNEPGRSFHDKFRFSVQDFLLHFISIIPGIQEEAGEAPDSIPGMSSTYCFYYSTDPAKVTAEFRRRVTVMRAAVGKAQSE